MTPTMPVHRLTHMERPAKGGASFTSVAFVPVSPEEVWQLVDDPASNWASWLSSVSDIKEVSRAYVDEIDPDCVDCEVRS